MLRESYKFPASCSEASKKRPSQIEYRIDLQFAATLLLREGNDIYKKNTEVLDTWNSVIEKKKKKFKMKINYLEGKFKSEMNYLERKYKGMEKAMKKAEKNIEMIMIWKRIAE